MDADFLIQAGHEGRTSGATGATGPIANERDWTPIISDEAARILRAAGYSVIREKADGLTAKQVKIAVAVHFDGASTPCASGTSFGYNDPTDKPAVDVLRSAYQIHVPTWIKRMPDNFTAGLRGYYGFKYWSTTISEFVWEVCEISCREQAAWAQPRLKWFGAILAHSLEKAAGGNKIPHPGAFSPISVPAVGTPIIGPPTSTKQQALNLLETNYKSKVAYPASIMSRIVDAYWVFGPREGVDPTVVFAQALKETGGFSFLTADGSVPASGYSKDQYNFAGIGTTGPGVPGNSWPTPEEGALGHIRRLRMYAEGTDEIYDINILKRSLPRSYWGCVTYVEDLGGPKPSGGVKWAVSPEYGKSIVEGYMRPIQRAKLEGDTPAPPPPVEPASVEELYRQLGEALRAGGYSL